MACLVPIQHKPTLTTVYRRLRDARKPARLALVAAMLRDRKPWAPAHS